MKLSLKVSNKWLDFLGGITELNANDVMWQWMEIYLDQPLAVRQSLWVKYTNKKYGEHTHEILFSEDGSGTLARAYIPPGVIKIPGEWSFQAFIRQYSVTNPTQYIESSSNVVTFTVATGLPLDEEGAPVTNATIGSLYEYAKSKICAAVYEVEVHASDNKSWVKNGNVWEIRILQTSHNFSKINSIVIERQMEDGLWENMVYSYKRYKSGTVAVIVDEKIDVRIIIKGEK